MDNNKILTKTNNVLWDISSLVCVLFTTKKNVFALCFAIETFIFNFDIVVEIKFLQLLRISQTIDGFNEWTSYVNSQWTVRMFMEIWQHQSALYSKYILAQIFIYILLSIWFKPSKQIFYCILEYKLQLNGSLALLLIIPKFCLNSCAPFANRSGLFIATFKWWLNGIFITLLLLQ